MKDHASKFFPHNLRSHMTLCGRFAERTTNNRTTLIVSVIVVTMMTFSSDENLSANVLAGRQDTNLEPGRAHGKMIYQGKTTTLNYVYAKEDRDLLDESVYEVDLLFSQRPVSQIPPDESHLYTLKIRVNRKQSLGAIVYREGSLEANLVGSQNKFAVSNFSNQLLEARVYSEEVVPDKLQYDVRFKASIEPDEKDVPVTVRTGKPLPSGGGAPGKAYLEFTRLFPTVKTRQDIEQKLRKYLPDNADPASLIAFAGVGSVQVTGGFTKETKATLSIRATYQGSPCTGKVNLIYENEQWKIIRHGLMSAELGKLSF